MFDLFVPPSEEMSHLNEQAVPKKIKKNPAISVIGLGYVGAVSIGCFARLGFQIIGVDIEQEKLDAIQNGRSPIVEKFLDDLLQEGIQQKLISTTNDVVKSVMESDVTLVSVGTPSAKDGGPDLVYLENVAKQIGEGIAKKDSYHVIVIRSTIPPRTTQEMLLPIIEKHAGKKHLEDFAICFNPEFLRESTAVNDFFNPPKTVIGGPTLIAERMLEVLYGDVPGPKIATSIEVAEMIKYVDNAWHALKVGFANEVGKISKAYDIDSHAVMDIFVKDLKLNLSPYYLKPGFAYGGSCLPKDVRAINYIAQKKNVDIPILANVNLSNQKQIEHCMDLIERYGVRKVAVLGVSFKHGTDDLRETPIIPLMAKLDKENYDVKCHDFTFVSDNAGHYARRFGAKDGDDIMKFMKKFPKTIERDLEKMVNDAELLILWHDLPEYKILLSSKMNLKYCIDLVRVNHAITDHENYEGICW